METKKHASKDLHAQRKRFFLIGLSISLTLVIMAFEWTTAKKIVVHPTPHENVIDIPFVVPVTIQTVSPPTIQKENVKIETKPIVPIEFVVAKDLIQTEPLPSHIDKLEPSDVVPIVIPPMDTEDTEDFVLFPEHNAEPVGGYKHFYETILKNIKYPKQASRIGIEGKVFVQFVIDKSGTPTDFKISRGIGAGCNEEAIRVIALTKWEPAKQRGRPVRVRMTMPVVFQLSH